jgi:chemotaxis protein MotB
VQVFAGSEVTVAREGGDVVVVIPAALLFSGWGLTLRAESAMTLDLLGTALKLHPELEIEVVGHMDDTLLPSQVRKQVGTIWELGAIRAAAVTRALIDTHGVEAQRFFVGSRGAAQPIDTTDTSEGRMRNRRVELRLRKAQNR